MVTLDDVRMICSELPGAVEGEGRFGFSVVARGKPKGFLWSWAERVHPRKARVPNDGVLAVVVPDLVTKEILLGLDAEKFFTEPHYNGFPAVLVRLATVEPDELAELVIAAWRCKAPPELKRQYDER